MANYGTAAGVGALVPKWAGSGDFSDTTQPTAAQVTSWLTQVSAMLDSILAQAGFTVPITDDDVTPTLDAFVNGIVAEMVEGTKGMGRFGPRRDGRQAPQSRFRIVMDDVQAFVDANAFGFEQMGAERSNDVVGSISFRDVDEAGDDVHPIFQRKAFGNSFKNWDSS